MRVIDMRVIGMRVIDMRVIGMRVSEAGTASQAASRRERVGVDMSGAGGPRSRPS